MIYVADPIQKLRLMCAAQGQKAVAGKLGFSTAYINDVLHDRREISDKMAKALGYERVTTWRRILP